MKNSTQFHRRFLARVGAICAAGAVLAVPAFGQEGPPGVRVSEYGRVDIAVQDTDLIQVLEMLSIQGRKNIIASPNVSATVSANLYDVTFYEALDAILRVNGYGYIEEVNFIYVYTQGELEQIGRTESRIYNLAYLSAEDANEFITPLLSNQGKSSARGDVDAGFDPDLSDGGADTYAYNAKIVVNDYPENLNAIEALLNELDTPPQQVLIESTILQTTIDESTSLGLDFSLLDDLDFTDLVNPLSPVGNLLAGSDSTTGFQPADNAAKAIQGTVGNTVGSGGFKAGIITDNIAVFLKLLDEVSDVTVLARPKVMALNRQRAEVLVGSRIGYLSTTSTQTTTTQTVQFLDTGIQLIFRPFISTDGTIRLELAPSVSEASLRTVTDANGLLVTIPDELTNELTTNVRIRDGQTLVLGGMFKESTRISRRQIPFLGDIPILGMVFRGQDDVTDRDEIMFLITPTIVKDEVLWELGNQMQGYADSAIVGARKGLLPFGRTSVTANYNRDAVEAWRAGKLKLALHYVNSSLRYYPGQPSMRELRREISGERHRAYDASVLERAFRRALGPLPRERALLPREVTVGGSASGALESLQLDLDEQGPWSGGTDQQVVVEPLPPVDPQPADATGSSQPDRAVIITPSRDHPVTRQMPRMLSPQPFWRAGHPAGYDDPALGDSAPFVTFDDMSGVIGPDGQ